MSQAKQVMSEYQSLIFDLDGTLMHTEPDIRKAINGALRDCGYRELPTDLVLPNLYSTLTDIIAEATALIDVPPSAVPALHDAYRIHYVAQAHGNSVLYPGVMDFLKASAARGCVMAVCTNKNEAFAHQALERTGVHDFFICVTGGNTTEHSKPHPLPLEHTLAQMGVSASESIMLGDTHVDAATAQNAGVAFALHKSGYGGIKLEGYPTRASFNSYREL
jgi:phosphoglycolate phosphatase